MDLISAYNQHKDYASETIKKLQIYKNPDAKKLLSSGCAGMGITPEEIDRFYFGNFTLEKQLRNRPLAKLTRDFMEEYDNALHHNYADPPDL